MPLSDKARDNLITHERDHRLRAILALYTVEYEVLVAHALASLEVPYDDTDKLAEQAAQYLLGWMSDQANPPGLLKPFHVDLMSTLAQAPESVPAFMGLTEYTLHRLGAPDGQEDELHWQIGVVYQHTSLTHHLFLAEVLARPDYQSNITARTSGIHRAPYLASILAGIIHRYLALSGKAAANYEVHDAATAAVTHLLRKADDFSPR